MQEMLLNYTTNKNIVIEARESCRVPVPVERCSLFNSKKEKAKEETENNCMHSSNMPKPKPYFIIFLIVFPTDSYMQPDEKEINQRICSEHISKLVKLNWSLLNSDIKGLASLKGITLSSPMLGLITIPPLKWGNLNIYFCQQQQLILISLRYRYFHQRHANSLSIGHYVLCRSKHFI